MSKEKDKKKPEELVFEFAECISKVTVVNKTENGFLKELSDKYDIQPSVLYFKEEGIFIK